MCTRNINKTPKRFIEESVFIEVKVWILKFIAEAVLSALSEVFSGYSHFKLLGNKTIEITVIALKSTQDEASVTLSTDEQLSPRFWCFRPFELLVQGLVSLLRCCESNRYLFCALRPHWADSFKNYVILSYECKQIKGKVKEKKCFFRPSTRTIINNAIY